MRLVQSFSKRGHDFTVQVAQHTKKPAADFEETWVKFAMDFWGKTR
ncbi:hypothetical protein F441_00987 [Phytophthora nicotianae CJ01A1]|uniref:Uncharacterized protein n=2 Tax=Phytophthora nicotianae TaxID=4792 RepID=W2XWE4_PHYNI|nr:hypothetical protein L915_00953 [Phytophthora nicotianae]ETP26234.1 hypothetical protein F441_00987 [Phytophthora nicotianae CJ01A1]